MACINRVGTATWTNEWYETATGEAVERGRKLRKLGYKATVSAMGSQVTDVGLIRLSLVGVRHNGLNPPPWPEGK